MAHVCFVAVVNMQEDLCCPVLPAQCFGSWDITSSIWKVDGTMKCSAEPASLEEFFVLYP